MQAILGITLLLGSCWVFSENRTAVSWRFVTIGLFIQFLLALILLRVTWITEVLLGLNYFISAIEQATRAGTEFLFGYLGGGAFPVDLNGGSAPYLFAFRVLPQVIVFSVVVALLWHWKILPSIVRVLSKGLQKSLKVSGSVATAGAASLFLGMVETPLVIRAYLAGLTRMSTVAGSVMVLFASILEGVLPGIIGHILGASMINMIGAIYISRLLIPETQDTVSVDTRIDLTYSSSMDALSQGTKDGLALAVNVGAMLLVLVSFVALANILLSNFVINGQSVSIEQLLGWCFAPIAWLIGIPWSEAIPAGALLGTKLVLNELVAFIQLAQTAELFSPQSRLILLYALCGFANIGSLGILLGGLAVLIPERKEEYLQIAPRSVLSGTVVTLVTGAIVALVSRI
jgi:CNT family concentrative nucleoside transporter